MRARPGVAPDRLAVAGLVLALATSAAWPADPLQEYLRVRTLLAEGRLELAQEVADRLAAQDPSGLFRHLPQQVEAEREVRRGDGLTAAGLLRGATPPDGCLILHRPAYWNSCQRLESLYGALGEPAERVEMLRRLAFGAGARDGAEAAGSFLRLAEAYEDAGRAADAAAFRRAVLHCFEPGRTAREAREGLRRAGVDAGDSDAQILEAALATDPLLRHAGRAALPRLSRPEAALDVLLHHALSPEGSARALEVLGALPLADLVARLHQLRRGGDVGEQAAAELALERITGLRVPAAPPPDGPAPVLDDASPFAGVWGQAFLLERIADPYESDAVVLMALDALGRAADPRGLETILRHTADPRPAFRAHALHALRGYGGPTVEAAILARLADPEPGVRLVATAGLARRTLADAPDRLAEAILREEDPLVAAAMVEALGAQPSSDSSNILASLASRLPPPAARAAGEALWHRGDPRAAALLGGPPGEGGPGNGSPGELPGGPTALLDRLVPATPVLDPPTIPGPESAPEEIFRAALYGIPPPSATIARLVESPRWSEYRGAAIAMANAGDRSQMNVIRRRARAVTYGADGSERIRYDEEMIEVLGMLQDDGSAPLFREVLSMEGGRGSARAAAARALGRLGSADDLPALLATFLNPRSPSRLRRAAAWALSRLPHPDLGPLVLGGVESPDPEMRWLTLLLLRDGGSRWGGREAQHLERLEPDPRIRALAAEVSRTIPSQDG